MPDLDIEEQLRRYGEATERMAAHPQAEDTRRAIWSSRRVAVAAAAVLVIAGTAAVLTQVNDRDPRVEVNADRIDPTPATESWAPLPPSPLAARADAVTVWTGREMLVWRGHGSTTDMCGRAQDGAALCGEVARNDAAAFDPATSTWRTLPEGPMPPITGSVVHAEGVWTGSEMVVWGLREAVGAAYNPTTDQWRSIAKSPLGPRGAMAMAWTGEEVVVAGGLTLPADGGFYEPGSEDLVDAAAWNPATDQWRRLPDLPSPMNRITLVAVGDVLYAAADVGRPLFVKELYTLMPGPQQWEKRTSMPGTGDRTVIAAGKGLVEVTARRGESPAVATYDPASNQWSPLPPMPDGTHPASGVLWTGSEVLLLGGTAPATSEEADGAAFNVETGQWRVLPRAPMSLARRSAMSLVWTGKEALVWGGQNAGGFGGRVFADGARYVPGPAPSPPAPTPAEQAVPDESDSIDADLDGDGKNDHFAIHPETGTMSASTAKQPRLTAPLPPDWTNPRIVGAPDVNGDGRHEIVMRIGGETVTLGAIVVLAEDGLAVVPHGSEGQLPLRWFAHSMGVPQGTADVACVNVDGRASLVVTTSELLPGPPLERRWTRQIYVLEDARLLTVKRDSGTLRLPYEAPPPPDLPLGNRFACGDVLNGDELPLGIAGRD